MGSRTTGRPVKYIEDRIDNITACDNHGSDRTYDVELALDADHRMTALRYRVVDDYGAYFQFGLGTHGNGFSQTVGPYKIRAVGAEIYAVFTNKCQQGACRGFGSEVTNFMIERIVDAAVEELNLDPIAFRYDNFIRPEEFPYQIPTGNLYDSGNYPGALDMALQMLDYNGWREKQQLARTQGRYVGIGVASCQEKGVFSATEFWMLNRTPGFALTSSPESASVKIDATGKAIISLHAPCWGNSPETVAAMVLAEQLTMDPADISITYSDTDHGLPGTGPGGSRYTVMVTGAIAGAASIIKQKLKRLAGHMLEAGPHDLEFRNGKIGVKGASGLEVSIAEVATQAHFFRLSLPDDPDLTSGLDANYTYDHPLATLPKSDSDFGIFYPIMGHMCHMPVVEVDVKTGEVKFLDYVAVHDCGTMINPMTVDGHVRGGTAQGHRHGVARAVPVRQGWPAVADVIPGLSDAADRQRAAAGAHRSPGDAVALHRIWRQGSRRGRPHGRAAGGCERDRGCTAATRRAHRYASGHAVAAARADPRGRGAKGCSAVTESLPSAGDFNRRAAPRGAALWCQARAMISL